MSAEDAYLVSKTIFDIAFVARYIKIQPTSWASAICLRIESKGIDLVCKNYILMFQKRLVL